MWIGERRCGTISTWLSFSSSLVAKLSLLLLWLRLGACEFHDYYNLSSESYNYWTAVIRYTYEDPTDAGTVLREEGEGRYGFYSSRRSEEGMVIHVEAEEGLNHGCTPYLNPHLPPDEPWIALVQRGNCKFQQKVHMALVHNASAVVIYNHLPEEHMITMLHNETEIVTVFIGYKEGMTIAQLVDGGTRVLLNISMGEMIQRSGYDTSSGPNATNTVVLLTFLGILIIALIVIVIYAVRHAKHVHAKHQARMNQQTEDHLLPVYTPNGTEADVTVHSTAPLDTTAT